MITEYQEENEVVSDEQVITTIQNGIANSVGDWLNSADLSRERIKATNEYGMVAQGHLAPQGVSQIVSSDTVEVVEGYLALLSELILNDERLARFIPYRKTPVSLAAAQTAADLVNHVIFKENPGWIILSTWLKSALLWKNSIIYWEFIEDHCYEFKEFESLDQNTLDLMLAQSDEGSRFDSSNLIRNKGGSVELISEGEISVESKINEETGDPFEVIVHHDVRLRIRKIKDRIVIRNIRPELFRISRDSTSIEDASFVAIQEETTRSDIRKNYGDKLPDDFDFADIGDAGIGDFMVKYSEERAVRKKLVGEEYYLAGRAATKSFTDEANSQVFKTHAWIRLDRDGDGIAELKKFTIIGDYILEEEDTDEIPMACLVPFEVPHEFHGLSGADLARPTTLASTAILRGFVENVYMTNYAPKLADPNMVDFGALQNMKPKQVIPTQGSPANAVQSLAPDNISSGTVPLLEMLQLHKEQATGLSKAAQGLNDTLYVSGNSEEKVKMVQTATQIRLQYMARRFVETGFKKFLDGIYSLLKNKMSGRKLTYLDQWGEGGEVDPATLPDNMYLCVQADVGEFGNSNTLKKLNIVGTQIIPALKEAGAGSVVVPEAAANIATQTLSALNLRPTDYIEDYTTPEFKQKAEQSRKDEADGAAKAKAAQEEIARLDMEQRKGTIALTSIQTKNAMQDNLRQLMIAFDQHHQRWADLTIKAEKEGATPPTKPNIQQLFMMAKEILGQDSSAAINAPSVTIPDASQAPQPVGPGMAPPGIPGGMMNGSGRPPAVPPGGPRVPNVA